MKGLSVVCVFQAFEFFSRQATSTLNENRGNPIYFFGRKACCNMFGSKPCV